MTLVYWIPAIVYALLIYALSSQSHPPGVEVAPDYVLHFIEYGVFALTVIWGSTRGLRLTLTASRAATAWLITSLYAATDEIHQFFVPERHASGQDFTVDLLGAFTFTLAAYLIIERFYRYNSK
ncbi:MAG: VanZ family protein [Acidobacteriota bacterium]